MTTEQKNEISEIDQREMYGLDCISSICYQTKANVDLLELTQPYLHAGKLKDLVIYFRQNQKDWLDRMLRAIKEFGKIRGIDWHTAMKNDLDGSPLVAMTDIIRNLYQVKDMEGVATLVEEATLIEDLTPVIQQIKFIIQNEKYRQEALKNV